MRKFLLSIWEVAEVIIVAAASIFIIYRFVAQPFLVQGASMEPNFYDGNYLIVDEVTYRFQSPARGEVIVFHNPTNEKEFYIKRIIGLPGERIVIKGSNVSADGAMINEIYLPSDLKFNNDIDITLKSDEYFVMGDNRLHSFDSRIWGPLKKDKIVGAVRVRFWPPAQFKFFVPSTIGTKPTAALLDLRIA